MIVYNNVTKDHRVVREAETLQAAGHQVELVGIPDAAASAPVETLESGVRVHRVLWQANAYGSLLRSAALRILPLVLLLGLLGWGLMAAAEYLLSGSPATESAMHGLYDSVMGGVASATWLSLLRYIVYALIAVALFYVLVRLTSGYVAAMGARRRISAGERELMMRYADGLFDSQLFGKDQYPIPRSRIPDWLPESLLELFLEPMDWLGGRSGRFVLYRYRARELADLVIRLKPDIVHCHDCIALPTGVLVKQALGIPLVYDAHEVYEAAAARRFGIVDYYTRIHRKYLPFVDRFITINQSAARFYRYVYPYLPPAVIIRNATRRQDTPIYDGRMHAAAGLPRNQKILLYQGGYTAERGLPTVVRAGAYLPEGWTLVLMGWGPLAGQLRRIAAVDERRRRQQGEKRVVFLPGVPNRELAQWTAGAAVGIIPYEDTVFNHWICSPNKLWEFPNAGVPIIIQPFPELRKVVETYNCGWVLPPDFTVGTVLDQVASLTDEMIAEGKAGCREFIAADNWDIYAARLVELYDGFGGAQGATPRAAVPA